MRRITIFLAIFITLSGGLLFWLLDSSSGLQTLARLAGSADKQELILKGGHVGLVAGRGAELRMWPALDAWLAPRSA